MISLGVLVGKARMSLCIMCSICVRESIYLRALIMISTLDFYISLKFWVFVIVNVPRSGQFFRINS